MSSDSRSTIRAHLAAKVRHHPDDTESITALRRDLAAQRLEDYIKATVAAAPPLTADQKTRLALLLRPTQTSGGGHDVT